MRAYDPGKPLIVIHIPKAGGVSSQKFFRQWFGNGFLRHYYDERNNRPPQRYALSKLHSAERPVVLHGHFNSSRGFGIEECYPEVKQFITILRDPFELSVSSYFYTRKVGAGWKSEAKVPAEDVETYLLNSRPNMLNHFPREITRSNFKDIIEEFFIEVGITEQLGKSMRDIAEKLGRAYDGEMLGQHNVTERDQDVRDYVRDLFIEKNQLEYDIYNYVRCRHE